MFPSGSWAQLHESKVKSKSPPGRIFQNLIDTFPLFSPCEYILLNFRVNIRWAKNVEKFLLKFKEIPPGGILIKTHEIDSWKSRHKPVVRASVSEVDDQLKGLVAERLEGEDDVVDQEVAVRFPDLVPTRDVVEDRVAGAGCSSLKQMNHSWSGRSRTMHRLVRRSLQKWATRASLELLNSTIMRRYKKYSSNHTSWLKLLTFLVLQLNPY